MKTASNHLAVLLLCTLLVACVSRPPNLPVAELLHDQLFAPSHAAVDAAGVFALSDDMRRYAAAELQATAQRRDPRRALIEALYSRGQLGLRYDAAVTRNAAEAYAARAGNCLSLVIMTAAFAKHLGLPVSYRSVLIDDVYTRQGGLYMASGHVNLVLDRPPPRAPFGVQEPDALTIDFLPPEELRGQRSEPLAERTIMAMFMNNRAAEALSQGRLADSYAWAREAVRQDPGFAAAVNTLAVVYMRAGHLREAEAALRALLAREPEHVSALSNLVHLLQRAGRAAEAQALGLRLAQLQPYPPFHFFDLGRQAMNEGDFRRARQLFARELRRQPDQHEVHFWAAQADLQLGDTAGATGHLRQAMANSPTRDSQQVYAAKLDRLRAARLQ
ncbi:MAG: tetratricopeptide repeat protein [Rubrivivax sp.]|nr:tetratricopeptide repeat protein [Rubrivivax sp.]